MDPNNNDEIEHKEMQINGPAMLYAAMRDVINAWRIGFLGETEMTSFLLILPDDVHEEVQPIIKTRDPTTQEEELKKLKLKYTKHVGYKNQVARFNPDDINYLSELKELKRAHVQEMFSIVVRSLSKHKYIYNEKNRVMDRGAMSLYAEMGAEE